MWLRPAMLPRSSAKPRIHGRQRQPGSPTLNKHLQLQLHQRLHRPLPHPLGCMEGTVPDRFPRDTACVGVNAGRVFLCDSCALSSLASPRCPTPHHRSAALKLEAAQDVNSVDTISCDAQLLVPNIYFHPSAKTHQFSTVYR